jgi:hypothetical protein
MFFCFAFPSGSKFGGAKGMKKKADIRLLTSAFFIE